MKPATDSVDVSKKFQIFSAIFLVYFQNANAHLLNGFFLKYQRNAPTLALYVLDQRFPTFLTREALFRINFYGGAP